MFVFLKTFIATSDMQDDILPPSKVSLAVAAMPDTEFAALACEASAAVSSAFENRNVVDVRYPAHISLLLAGLPEELLPTLATQLGARIRSAWSTSAACEMTLPSLCTDTSGFIGLDCEPTGCLLLLHQIALQIFAPIHRQRPTCRPHLVRRWPQLSVEQRQLLWEFGTYKVGAAFHPHMSLASVDPQSVDAAAQLVEGVIKIPRRATIRSVQLVNIGHQNEQWNILEEWPVV